VRLARWLAIGGLVLYLLSLWLPAVRGSGFPTQSGWDMLEQGASGWRDGIVAWYANPALWLTVVGVLIGRFRIAAGLAAVGFVLALSSFSAATIAEAGGRSVPAFSFAVGFYVWLGAFVLVSVAAAIGIFRTRDI
jgi:hypothetical protein